MSTVEVIPYRESEKYFLIVLDDVALKGLTDPRFGAAESQQVRAFQAKPPGSISLLQNNGKKTMSDQHL